MDDERLECKSAYCSPKVITSPSDIRLLLAFAVAHSSTKPKQPHSDMAATTSHSAFPLPAGGDPNVRTCNEFVKQANGTETTIISVPCPATYLSALTASSTPAAEGASSTPAGVAEPTITGGANDTSNPLFPSQASHTVSSTGVASNSTGSTGKKGLEGGAVAGVAIGMLLAGALIAGVIFFFLLRRQKRRQAMSAAGYSRQDASYTERNAGPEKGATVVAASVGSIEDLLPQPAEDDAITGDLSKIRDNIKNHVRTYYHSGPISAADINEADIHDIAALTGSSAATIIKALSNSVTRDNALRSIVGSVILTRCTVERSPSLLPNEVAALSASIPASNGNNCKSILCPRRARTNSMAQLNRFCSANGNALLEPCCNSDTESKARIPVGLKASKTRSHR